MCVSAAGGRACAGERFLGKYRAATSVFAPARWRAAAGKWVGAGTYRAVSSVGDFSMASRRGQAGWVCTAPLRPCSLPGDCHVARCAPRNDNAERAYVCFSNVFLVKCGSTVSCQVVDLRAKPSVGRDALVPPHNACDCSRFRQLFPVADMAAVTLSTRSLPAAAILSKTTLSRSLRQPYRVFRLARSPSVRARR